MSLKRSQVFIHSAAAIRKDLRVLIERIKHETGNALFQSFWRFSVSQTRTHRVQGLILIANRATILRNKKVHLVYVVISHMKPLASSTRHCVISVAAVIGSFIGWNLWFVYGGWQRRGHWGEGSLWAAFVIIGLWGAIDAIRFTRAEETKGVGVAVISIFLIGFHFLSLLLLLMFVSMLAQGGPRP